jgi:hypothetical protein
MFLKARENAASAFVAETPMQNVLTAENVSVPLGRNEGASKLGLA